MKVESIQIAGFRTFDKFELKEIPDGLIFVIGKNGSGKSNLVAALRALVSNVIGGWTVMAEDVRQPWNGSSAAVSVVVSLLPVELEKIVRTGLLSNQPPGFADYARNFGSKVSKVRLTAEFRPGLPGQGTTGNRALQFFGPTGGPLRTPTTGPELAFVPNYEMLVSRYIAENIHCLGPVRTPTHLASTQSMPEMGYDGRNLGNILFPNVTGFTPEYETLVADLRAVFPSLDRPILPVTPQPREDLEVAFRETGMDTPIRLDRASSGQVEALTILLRLVTSPPGSFVTLEEPEAHFHGDALRRLASIIKRRAEEGTQILVSSHSGVLVADNRLPVSMPVYFLERDPPGATKVTTLSRERDIALIDDALE
jgi:predicted ATPase